MKNLLAIITGIIAGLAVWFLGYLIFTSMYPLPNDLNLEDRKELAEYVTNLPPKAYITQIIAHCATLFMVGLVSSIIGKSWRIQSGIIAVLPFLVYFIYENFDF